jgi:hypothetical protein
MPNESFEDLNRKLEDLAQKSEKELTAAEQRESEDALIKRTVELARAIEDQKIEGPRGQAASRIAMALAYLLAMPEHENRKTDYFLVIGFLKRAIDNLDDKSPTESEERK